MSMAPAGCPALFAAGMLLLQMSCQPLLLPP